MGCNAAGKSLGIHRIWGVNAELADTAIQKGHSVQALWVGFDRRSSGWPEPGDQGLAGVLRQISVDIPALCEKRAPGGTSG